MATSARGKRNVACHTFSATGSLGLESTALKCETLFFLDLAFTSVVNKSFKL